MAEYRLKAGQERIQVVDGPLAGQKYQPGMVYAEIPQGEADRFEELAQPAPKKVKADKEIEQ